MSESASQPLLAPRSSFRLIHLMGIVLAVGATLASVPALMVAIMKSYGPASFWSWIMYASGVVTLALIGWTFLVAALTVVLEGRKLRDAGQSYGMSAVLAAGVALGFALAAEYADSFEQWSTAGWPIDPRRSDKYLRVLGGMLHKMPLIPSSAIAAAWVLVALSRQGRRPSFWIEILGFILATCWLVWCFFGRVLLLKIPFWLRGDVPSWS